MSFEAIKVVDMNVCLGGVLSIIFYKECDRKINRKIEKSLSLSFGFNSFSTQN